MATKTKTKKKHTKSKRTASRRAAPVKKAIRKKPAKKRAAPKKKLAKKKPAAAKPKVKATVRGKKTAGRKTAGASKKKARRKSRIVDTLPLDQRRRGARSEEQSGDLQGLSNVEGADSESVDELLEEGNAFEAEVVQGVEDAGTDGEKEVRTHEVPEDDVPGEYDEQ